MKLQQEIVLSKNHMDVLTGHAKTCSPNESCAILFGRIEGNRTIISEIFLANNTENSPTTFTISNKELIQAYSEAEKRKLEVIGIFHSHPHSAAYPSATDKKYMEINPVPWIIFSNVENQFAAYIFESEILPVLLTIF